MITYIFVNLAIVLVIAVGVVFSEPWIPSVPIRTVVGMLVVGGVRHVLTKRFGFPLGWPKG